MILPRKRRWRGGGWVEKTCDKCAIYMRGANKRSWESPGDFYSQWSVFCMSTWLSDSVKNHTVAFTWMRIAIFLVTSAIVIWHLNKVVYYYLFFLPENYSFYCIFDSLQLTFVNLFLRENYLKTEILCHYSLKRQHSMRTRFDYLSAI